MSPTSNVDWSSLPSDPLTEISGRLTFDPDYVVFRSVCQKWRSATPKRVFPWLIGHRKDSDAVYGLPTFHRFDCCTNLSPVLDLPFIGKTRCYGSSHGWMALLYTAGPRSIVLRNPITSSEISLPNLPFGIGLTGLKYSKFLKGDESSWDLFVLSADPARSPTDYAAVVSYNNGSIALWRVGDDAWTSLRGDTRFTGVAFYQGRLYVSSFNGTVYVYRSVIPWRPKRIASVSRQLSGVQPVMIGSHLLSSGDDLLLVMAYWTVMSYHFSVFKVDFGAEEVKLVELKDLGDRALFLARSNSFSVVASTIPGCERNKIYCVETGFDHGPKSCMKIRIYDMKDKITVFIPSDVTDPHPDWMPCAWFMPNILPSNLGASN